MRARWIAMCSTAAIMAAICLWMRSPPPTARIDGVLPQAAYVWQRVWTPAVCEAVTNRALPLTGITVLAGELEWKNGVPLVHAVTPDWRRCAAASCQIGFAIRIHTLPPDCWQEERGIETVSSLVNGIVREARRQGVRPVEIHLDLDCPESKLATYGVWLRRLRRHLDPIPLAVTVLPAWLDRGDFESLVRAADSFVLQVHSLSRPEYTTAAPLCDVRAARRAVKRAARYGRPFWVALPTYSYVAVFDGDRRLIGMAADGSLRRWPEQTEVRVLRADPQALAGLIRDWATNRPNELRGAIWYRLPVADDVLNWPACTLRSVMAGNPPRADVRVSLRSTDEHLTDIALINAGHEEAVLTQAVTISWSDAALEAADALGDFTYEHRSGAVGLRFEPHAERRLRPGETLAVGWLRLSEGGVIEARLEAATNAIPL